MKPELFVSKATNRPLPSGSQALRIVKDIPRQFSMTEQKVVEESKEIVKYVGTVSLGFSVAMTAVLKAMWAMNHMI